MGSVTEPTPVLSEDRSAWPKIAIIVLNWNNYEDTAACLRSLEEVTYPNYVVFVVDNGSTDGSGEMVAAEFEWCTVIHNDENLGFAAGNNVGIRRALEDGFDHVVLLNNDTVVQDSFLTPLVQTAEADSNIALVSGVIYDEDGDIWFCGGELIPQLVKGSKYDRQKHEREAYSTGYVTGALMLLTRRFLMDDGLLNEDYFYGMEDKEISYRALQSDWKLRINPNSQIQHAVSSTSGSGNEFSYYASTYNRLHFATEHLGYPRRVIFFMSFMASRIGRSLQWMTQGDIGRAYAIWLAIFDYYIGGGFQTDHLMGFIDKGQG